MHDPFDFRQLFLEIRSHNQHWVQANQEVEIHPIGGALSPKAGEPWIVPVPAGYGNDLVLPLLDCRCHPDPGLCFTTYPRHRRADLHVELS
jgi:hypothetical protein